MLDNHENIIMEADEQKIKAFLATDKGRIITNLALEQQMAYETAALGIRLAELPSGQREEILRERLGANAIRLGIDQGFLDRFLQDKAIPWLTAHITDVGGRTNIGLLQNIQRWQTLTVGGILSSILSGVGFAAFGPPGIAAGAAPAVVAETQRSLRHGVTLEIQQSAEMP